MSVEQGKAIQNLNQNSNILYLKIFVSLASNQQFILMTASTQIFDQLNDNSSDYTSLNREQAIEYLYDRLVEYADNLEWLNRNIKSIKYADLDITDDECIAIIMANHLKLHKEIIREQEANTALITINYDDLIFEFHPQFVDRPNYAIVKGRFIEELSTVINRRQDQENATATLTIEMVEKLIPPYWTRSSVNEEGASEPENVTYTNNRKGLTIRQNNFPLHISDKMRFVMGILSIYGDLLKDNFKSPPQLIDCLAKYLQNTRREQAVSS